MACEECECLKKEADHENARAVEMGKQLEEVAREAKGLREMIKRKLLWTDGEIDSLIADSRKVF
jgi:hypothetical protein